MEENFDHDEDELDISDIPESLKEKFDNLN